MKRFHVEQRGKARKEPQGAFGGQSGNRVSDAAVIESSRAAPSLPEPEKLLDLNRVQVRLTTEYKQWFRIVANLEHRDEGQQGRKVIVDWVDGWKRAHPDLVEKYEPLVRAAMAEVAA